MNSVELINISKHFGSLMANDGINLKVRDNSVHCIIGENGAGKSTLMKILFGIYRPDSGEIRVNGIPAHFRSAHDAIKLKIGMLHQHFMLVEDFSVIENVILGNELSKGITLDFDKSRQAITGLIEKYNLSLNPDSKVSDLNVSEKQKTELLKLLYRQSEIIIFDEPTAVLSPVEVGEFFKIITKFRDEGKTIIVITHKLKEVREIADDVTVLRRGKSVYSVNRESLDIDVLAKEIVGELEPATALQKINMGNNDIAVEIENIVLDKGGVRKLDGLNMKLRKGEVYGVCGVEGNGQGEIADLIFGLEKYSSGKFITFSDLISLIPDDRIEKGMIKEFSVGENVILKNKNINIISKNLIAKTTSEIVSKYDIRLSDYNAPLQSLSGGNQQKVIFAREIELDNDILVFAHPTRGVDINASAFIHSVIISERNKGKTVLLISSDLDEIFFLADRIGVLYKGKIVREFSSNELSSKSEEDVDVLLEKIGKLMIGITVEE
ncbi:MAG: ABC transporter ATP-binding protein [Ignavibacteriae bacterium]|nr:ABC transporter ATP-binding protein [Ignavibacteriota bacterium]